MTDAKRSDVVESNAESELIEHEDYYFEGHVMVFTARFHLRRGYCCGSGCRHCPYKIESAEENAR